MLSSVSTSQVTPIRSQEEMGYSWANSGHDSHSMSRQLTYFERTFVVLYQAFYGQNCPFIGATISLRCQDHSPKSYPFNFSQLHKRSVEAFYQTRWKYPTVAARIVDDDKALYNTESEVDVRKWAERTVSIISQDGGWRELRERLSRDSPLPTRDGDYCVIYLIVRPYEAAQPKLKTFDVLMHTHHVFTDGSGIRSILNEFLSRLAEPLAPGEIVWGEEVDRLLPPSLLLENDEDTDTANGAATPPVPGERLKGYFEPDTGLPVYRPDILAPNPENRGSLLVSHTFEDRSFLPQLLTTVRKQGVKLTAVLHAALLKAVYDLSDIVPNSEEIYKSGSAMDLRNGYMIPPYGERYNYVNCAVAIHSIQVPCNLFKNEGKSDDFWKAATFISNQWAIIKKKKGMAKTAEADAKARVDFLKKISTSSKVVLPKPRTCPYFVSDPPGSQQLSAAYPISEYENLCLVLESYQLATDQNHAAVSARSHSWNDQLTLCLAFNAIRNPIEKMQEFLDKWVKIVEEVCNSGSYP